MAPEYSSSRHRGAEVVVVVVAEVLLLMTPSSPIVPPLSLMEELLTGPAHGVEQQDVIE